MQDNKIRFSADDSQLKNAGRTAQSIVENMIRSSRQYSTSSKEVLRDIEEQIRAIEKRNKIDLEGKRAVIQEEKIRISQLRDEMLYEARAIQDPKKRSSAIREVQSAYAFNKQSVSQQESVYRAELEERKKNTQELRNIVDSINKTSKEEIKADREGVEKVIRKDKSLGKLGIDGDFEQGLKRTIQKGLLGDIGRTENEESSNFKNFGRFTGRTFNTASGAITSKNELFALAGVLGLVPFVGQGMSSMAQRFLSGGETAENAMAQHARANFLSYDQSSMAWNNVSELGLSSLGLDPSQILTRGSQLRRIAGRNLGARDFSNLMGAEQFVGGGTIDQLMSINRYGGGNVTDVLSVLENNQRDITRLTENIGTYIQAANKSTQLSSNVNELQLARNIMGISSATGQTGIGLDQTVGAIQGLGNSGNPVVRSLMMRAYRKSNPNASLFDIQAMMEDPLSSLQSGGGQFLSSLRQLTGGGDMYKQVLYSAFGGNLSRKRINEIVDNGDLDKIIESSNTGENVDWLEEAKKGAPKSKQLTAEMEVMIQGFGKEMLSFSADMVKKIEDAAKTIMSGEDKEMDASSSALSKSIDKNTAAINTLTTELKKQ